MRPSGSARHADRVGTDGGAVHLDEPSIGLHQRDNARLISTLHGCATGNTLIVVEHDEETIRAADHIVDIGPGAASTAVGSWCRARSRKSSGVRSR